MIAFFKKGAAQHEEAGDFLAPSWQEI